MENARDRVYGTKTSHTGVDQNLEQMREKLGPVAGNSKFITGATWNQPSGVAPARKAEGSNYEDGEAKGEKGGGEDIE